MATLLLSAAGAALGGSIGGAVLGVSAAAIGQAIGASVGGMIDQKVFGFGSQVVDSGRADKFRVQSSAEGSAIPLVLGTTRVAGQLIWSSNFKETVTSSEQGGGKGVSGPWVTVNAYTYSVSVAVALCEGEITKIGRIWADGKEISKADLNICVYSGAADQLPDPTIASVEGLENTPAYRGTAYVVFENLQLADYGNRIPQLNFEVFRRAQPKTVQFENSADLVPGVCLIPGTGEYSLSPEPVHYAGEFGENRTANVNTLRGIPDFVGAVDDLKTDLPNCKSTSLVVSWFGDDLRCSSCKLVPKVEHKLAEGAPNAWKVAGLDRGSAPAVSQVAERPVFGGTPDDKSVRDAISHLKAEGQKVVFYPFILMDIQDGNQLPDPWTENTSQPVMPWRGRITLDIAPGKSGSTDKTAAAGADVSAFFGSAAVSDFSIENDEVVYTGPDEWSYRRFILHYANLCASVGGVDLFCIGSELRSLTQIRDSATSFPAVTALRQLANDVQQILGAGVQLTYAADWSEYFGYHPQDSSGDVLFHLDDLWADAAISCIGIDNYMPMSDWRAGDGHLDRVGGARLDVEYLKSQINGGEGFDWFYANQADREAQIRTPITDGANNEPWVYRYKDLRNWWEQAHHNRVGGIRAAEPTAWQPQSKPFVFTEYGCPSVDKGTNQPNVFIDPKSSESSAPYFSSGNTDDAIQHLYIKAMHDYWTDSNNNPNSVIDARPMVDFDASLLWAWDARPWPDFPSRLSIWSDGGNYARGHWFSGKSHVQELAAVVAEICERSGVVEFDVSNLRGGVSGFYKSGFGSAREALQQLMMAYRFTSVEIDGKIKFLMQDDAVIHDCDSSDLAVEVDGNGRAERTRSPEISIPKRLQLGFVDSARDYQSAQIEHLVGGGTEASVSKVDLALVTTRQTATKIVQSWARSAAVSNEAIEFSLPPSRAEVVSGDVVRLFTETGDVLYRVENTEEKGGRLIAATRLENKQGDGVDILDAPVEPEVVKSRLPVYVKFLDLPMLRQEDVPHAPYVAATARPWPGNVAVFDSSQDENYSLRTVIDAPSTFAHTLTELPICKPHLWSRADLRISPTSLEFSSATELDVLNGDNALAIWNGNIQAAEVLQFQKADILPDGSVLLQKLLRGQLGTDAEMPASWPIGSEVVLLSENMRQVELPPHLIDVERHYRVGPGSVGYSDAAYTHHVQTFTGNGERPYSPAHLRARSNTDGDIVLTWIRRTRLGGDTWQGVDVPLGEAREIYHIEIRKDGDLVRDAATIAANWTYLRADQILDVGSGPVEINVCQVSEKYGRGLTTRIIVNV